MTFEMTKPLKIEIIEKGGWNMLSAHLIQKSVRQTTKAIWFKDLAPKTGITEF